MNISLSKQDKEHILTLATDLKSNIQAHYEVILKARDDKKAIEEQYKRNHPHSIYSFDDFKDIEEINYLSYNGEQDGMNFQKNIYIDRFNEEFSKQLFQYLLNEYFEPLAYIYEMESITPYNNYKYCELIGNLFNSIVNNYCNTDMLKIFPIEIMNREMNFADFLFGNGSKNDIFKEIDTWWDASVGNNTDIKSYANNYLTNNYIPKPVDMEISEPVKQSIMEIAEDCKKQFNSENSSYNVFEFSKRLKQLLNREYFPQLYKISMQNYQDIQESSFKRLDNNVLYIKFLNEQHDFIPLISEINISEYLQGNEDSDYIFNQINNWWFVAGMQENITSYAEKFNNHDKKQNQESNRLRKIALQKCFNIKRRQSNLIAFEYNNNPIEVDCSTWSELLNSYFADLQCKNDFEPLKEPGTPLKINHNLNKNIIKSVNENNKSIVVKFANKKATDEFLGML